MSHEFRISRLGERHVESPLEGGFFLEDDAAVLADATLAGCRGCEGDPPALEEAGPRRTLFFDPATCHAGIVTCGGLCPGLNDAIRALTMVSWYRYGVRRVTGFRYGFEGLVAPCAHEPVSLNPEGVADIHRNGGTILGSSRGPQDPARMVDFLIQRKIDILFTIGGDGTQRGALAIAKEIERRGAAIAVVGIPKTIDNDISYTDRTFGFETAVAMTQMPIESAHMESKGVANGIGLVKLMGRESGFVAAYATLASSDVNLVLVPEVPFSLDRLFEFLLERLERKSHAVLVVAEGAGQDLVPSHGVDASGNRVFGDIGVFLKEAIRERFRGSRTPAAVRYIDPSYTIRSASANADDSVYCFQLAEHAVHAALTGRTAMVVGQWNGHFVNVPMEKAIRARKRIDPGGSLWQSVLNNTGQPARMT